MKLKGEAAKHVTVVILATFQLEKSSIHVVDEFRGDTEWPSKDERLDLSSFSDGTFVMVEVNNLSLNVLGKRSLSSVSSMQKHCNNSQFILSSVQVKTN